MPAKPGGGKAAVLPRSSRPRAGMWGRGRAAAPRSGGSWGTALPQDHLGEMCAAHLVTEIPRKVDLHSRY